MVSCATICRHRHINGVFFAREHSSYLMMYHEIVTLHLRYMQCARDTPCVKVGSGTPSSSARGKELMQVGSESSELLQRRRFFKEADHTCRLQVFQEMEFGPSWS